jgi:hypothetical protein
MRIGLHVKYLLFLLDFNETGLSGHIFEKYSNNKFHENLSSGSQVVPIGWIDRQTDAQIC